MGSRVDGIGEVPLPVDPCYSSFYVVSPAAIPGKEIPASRTWIKGKQAVEFIIASRFAVTPESRKQVI